MTRVENLMLLALLFGCERAAPPTRPEPVAVTTPATKEATKQRDPSSDTRAIARARPQSADPDAPAIGLALVAEAVERVTDLEFVPGRPALLVVSGQAGKAVLVELAAALGSVATPKATVLEFAVDAEGELGLLSIAFHPRYVENGRLFVHYNPRGKQLTRVVELELPLAMLGIAPAKPRRVLLEVEQPYKNHNGGELAFGPDGKLYLGLGDGGAAGDPHENGQNLGSLLGKILRFDVDGEALVPRDNPFLARSGVRPEIFAYGLRNPWKISFDPRGRLIAADVGQNKFEELDLVAAGDNLGWNTREAAHCFDPAQGCDASNLVEPIFEYGRELGGSITGGYVYTGSRIRALAGRYVFGDFLSRRLWALRLPERRGETAGAVVLGVFEPASAALGRDAAGELYVSDYGSGKIFKVVAL